MKIKYRKSDNSVVAMGECDFTEDSEFGVDVTTSEIPQDALSNYTRIAGGIDRKIKADLDAEKLSEKNARRSRKQAIRTKLDITKAEIKHLKELLEDGDDD